MGFECGKAFLEMDRVSMVEELKNSGDMNSEWATLAGDHTESLKRG